MITKQNRKAVAQATEFQQQTADGLADIYKYFDVLIGCEANNHAIVNACNEYLGQEVVPTVGIFQMVLDDNPDVWATLATSTAEKQKTRVLEEISELLHRMNPRYIKAEVSKLQYQTLAEVIARRDQIVERQRLSKLSSTAIRQELAAGRPKQHRYYPKDLLPAEITAAELNRILRSGEARVYMRRYGSDQLNDRLFNRS